ATAEASVQVNDKNVTKAEETAQSGRIINGFAVDIARYPFALTLRLDGRYRSSAVVISLSCALTGADHVSPYRNSIQRVTLYGGSSSATSGGVLFQVTRIAVHPNYVPNSGVADFNIAVLAVPTISFGGKRYIAPIPLAPDGVTIGTKCSVFGWGRTIANLPATATALRSADMYITSDATCARVWATFGVKITSNMLCANGGKAADLCPGDYGNALVCSGRLTGVAILVTTGTQYIQK
uniref:Uncharacterized protein n=1 Tax=Anopheles arabiensis TaxID=7173 RepID=A0A182HVQ8_ANOAR